MFISQYFISIFVLLMVTEEGLAIRCYGCSSILDSRCDDYFRLSRAAAQECTGSCVKYRGMRPTQVGDLVEITRMCIPKTADECLYTQYNGVDVYACTCNSDHCNGGLRMSGSVFGVVISSLALLYIHYI